MVDFIDRVPGQGKSGRKKLIYENGNFEYVTIENADEAVTNGTPINRAKLMGIQGFEAKTTVFNEDGSITETNGNGEVKTTVFNSDGSIVETFVGEKTITKTTVFNEDGSVVETIGEVSA